MKRNRDSRGRVAAGEHAHAAAGQHSALDPDGADGSLRPASAELIATVGAMLTAAVRLAGAAAGVVRIATPGIPNLQPLVTEGPPRDPRGGADAVIAAWCGACAESRDPDSECVRTGVCGRDERFSTDLSGWACRHVASFPLGPPGRSDGVLNLRFDAARGCPETTIATLASVAAAIGAVVEQSRLARDALRTALENERQMIANEVHDSLAQGLTYMRMRMSLLRPAIRQGDAERALKYWSDVDASLTDAHRRLRELITYFRCRMDAQGLVHALQAMSETFFDRTGIALEFANRVPVLDLPVGREAQVFHIVQEALANVCKHASARRARLTLGAVDGGYELVVEDDGIGMDAYAAARERSDAGHYGLSIMRERARRLGGELTVASAPGAGTRVRLYFPAMQPSADGVV